MNRILAALLGALIAFLPCRAEPGRVLDRFDSLAAWKAAPADGVDLALARVPGPGGSALRLSFDFHGGAGYAAARGRIPLELPADYEIAFWLRGAARPNTLEFKLVDPGGENVWWARKPELAVSARWTRVVLKKRMFSFAWGPAGGGEPSRVGWLELAVTAGAGGRGHLDIAGLTLRELPPVAGPPPAPQASAAGSRPGQGPERALDGSAATAWRSRDDRDWFQVDLGAEREFGGLVLDWDRDDFPRDFRLQGSRDGTAWSTLMTVRGAAGGRSRLPLPECQARFLRLQCLKSSRGQGWGLAELALKPLAYAATGNAFMTAVAGEAPRGDYPRGFHGEQGYWTLVGVDGGRDSGLLGEDGALEAGRGGFSVEPFLWTGDGLLRWSDVEVSQSLERDYLPIPTVRWRKGGLTMDVTSFASGPAQAPVLRCRYRVRNAGAQAWRGALFLAVRPYQVNPPTQTMGQPGGVMALRELELAGGLVRVNGKPALVPVSRPDGFGAAGFAAGPLIDTLHQGRLPAAVRVTDPLGLASGALRYELRLGPGESRDVFLDLPLAGAGRAGRGFEQDLAATAAVWQEKLNRVTFQVPDKALADTLRTCLAHILISRQGPALQPGTRSYARSWIRDGALMAAGLLRLGHPEEVRDFIRWFAPHQFASGRIPCVVDYRGADPVPENDSPGEFLYLLAEYARFTGDLGLVRACWPQVEKTVAFIATLTAARRTAAYQAGAGRRFYGLMPESISHEGYSAKPMHSYWDDFFTLRGLKDATELAGRLGRGAQAQAFGQLRDRFRGELQASLALTMAEQHIDYLPGCAELGDFDPTSTTVALAPGGERAGLPAAALDATFDRYYAEFKARLAGKGDRYTPYEMRAIGAIAELGRVDRAHALIAAFLADRRPLAWNQWPEVVQRDPRLPIFLGDLPHAWVGSDYIRSVLSLFAREREADQALVIAAGFPEAWLRAPGGAGVKGLRVGTGTLDLQARAEGDTVTYDLAGTAVPPPGGIVLAGTGPETFTQATIDGQPIPPGELVVRRLPARIVLRR